MFTGSVILIVALVLALLLLGMFAAPTTFRSLRSDSLIFGTTRFEGGIARVSDPDQVEKMRRDPNHGVEYVEVHDDPRVEQVLAQIPDPSPPSTAVPDSSGVQTAPAATTTQTTTDSDGDGVDDRADDEPPQNRKSNKSKR